MSRFIALLPALFLLSLLTFAPQSVAQEDDDPYWTEGAQERFLDDAERCANYRASLEALAEDDTSSAKQTLGKMLLEEEHYPCQPDTRWQAPWEKDKKKKDKDKNEEEDDDEDSWLGDFLSWLFDGSSGEGGNASLAFAQVLKGLLWALIIVGVIALLIWMTKGLDGLNLNKRKKADYIPPPPDELFGLNLRPESLPDDLADTVWQLWQNDNPRGALSLLYRAALSRIAQTGQVDLRASATEGECVTATQDAFGNGQLSLYFSHITVAWQSLAYAHRTLDAVQVKNLCEQWPKFEAELRTPTSTGGIEA